MTRVTIISGCLLFAMVSQAGADCSPGTQVKNELAGELTGKTVCGTGVGPNAGDKWQEYHQSGGTLTEYAKGADDPVDPTKDVGTWEIIGQGNSTRVSYKYGTSSGPYAFSVHTNGSTYWFCNTPGGTEVATATILSGPVSCGF